MPSSSTAAKQAAPTEYAYGDRVLVIGRGSPLPTGAYSMLDGVNFALICRHGTAVWLVLSEPCDGRSIIEIPLDNRYNRTGDHWHIRVDGLPQEFCYGYRVDGPDGNGNRFDASTILLDPYSRSLSCGRPWGTPGDPPRRSLMNRSMTERDVVPGPHVPLEDTIIYELHVRGFTVDPSSAAEAPGTFAGLTEKIDYLKWLGITAVELLPVDEFDEFDCPYVNTITGEPLKNYWGYNPITFGTPKAAYGREPERSEPWDEFCDMVGAFHRRGIEVILDIVFNHTAEGGDDGRTYGFRGLDNSLYYILDDRGRNMNFSGCGNTFNSDHPVVRNYLIACLRNWVAEAGVDGFRFDLASVFGRDRRGNVVMNSPTVNRISEDSLLYRTKLIAEPWDAGGLYQVGTFPGGARWSDWNGRYRDDVRRFWRGDSGMTSALATRVCGSDDLYAGRGPLHSLNFLCCHDGFTLMDLVSYDHKHNEANGEGNRDGSDANYSWNCGAEGPTDDPAVLRIRDRQARNLMATLLISQGVPMILGGDEFLRTQGGNNNAWCQDNPTSWIDWTLAERNAGFLRFVRAMIAFRKTHHVLRRVTFFNAGRPGGVPEILWHGVRPAQPDFGESSHAIAFALDGRGGDRPGLVDRDLYVAMNAGQSPLEFQIPAAPTGRPWRRVVDTARESPDDFLEEPDRPSVGVRSGYLMQPHSMIILVSDREMPGA